MAIEFASTGHPFTDRLHRALQQLGWDGSPTLVAVSGGGDSVALLIAMARLCQTHGVWLGAAHFNHGLRGHESDEDELFVRRKCEALGVPLQVGRPFHGSLSSTSGGSLEQAARLARYRFLLAAARESGARFVLTAHTADDQIETVLFRIIRGTGIRGLTGIPARRAVAGGPVFLRPFLGFWREEIRAFLRELGEDFREDSTNRDLRFTRNRIRHELLPLLERNYHPGVRQALWRLSAVARDFVRLTSRSVRRAFTTALVTEDFRRVVLDAQSLARYPDALLSELFRYIWRYRGWPEGSMTWRHWRLLTLMAKTAAQWLSGSPPGTATESIPAVDRSSGERSEPPAATGAHSRPSGKDIAPSLSDGGRPFGEDLNLPGRVPRRRTFPGRVEAIVSPGRLELFWLGEPNTSEAT